MDNIDKKALDDWITGHYGEDQFIDKKYNEYEVILNITGIKNNVKIICSGINKEDAMYHAFEIVSMIKENDCDCINIRLLKENIDV